MTEGGIISMSMSGCDGSSRKSCRGVMHVMAGTGESMIGESKHDYSYDIE